MDSAKVGTPPEQGYLQKSETIWKPATAGQTAISWTPKTKRTQVIAGTPEGCKQQQ